MRPLIRDPFGHRGLVWSWVITRPGLAKSHVSLWFWIYESYPPNPMKEAK